MGQCGHHPALERVSLSILDASVVLKWFVDERESQAALRIREEFVHENLPIIVPDLLLFECANALRYHPDFSEEEVHQSIDSLFQLGIDIITPTSSLLKKGTSIAVTNDVTVYDATYLALAHEIQDEFITADEKFYQKVQKQFPDTITLLRDRKSTDNTN